MHLAPFIKIVLFKIILKSVMSDVGVPQSNG
jgi:hypothetical protein